ncbi:MAG: ABC transporter substrate-binding protein [Bdellovibrionaceae bacterium]|jgi:ABC-type Fe3+-hydroxamate transport system substrate-binding protein|nr:ABC transporter substrate-binding protein [Pseudobdellovibrionaceae bacterium]
MYTKKSSCNGYCTYSKDNQFCLGCLRTPNEITNWSITSDINKKRIELTSPQRRFNLSEDSFIKDQLGNYIAVDKQFKKVISLVPSITQTFIDLGLQNCVVGHTKFCPQPNKHSIIIGGTKNLNFDNIYNLDTDLIAASKEENTQEEISRLQEHYKVFITDVTDFEDSLSMIETFAEVFNRKTEAYDLIHQTLEKLSHLEGQFNGQTCAYLIWKKPYMVAGNDTFIQSWLKHLGFINVFNDEPRYPIIDLDNLVKLNPDVLFLPTEPYHFQTENSQELIEAMPHSKIWFIDGRTFSWFGSHMLKASENLLL